MLEKLGAIRQELCMERAPLNSPDKAAWPKITTAIDDFAEVVTGNWERFWMKMHRTMSGPNQ